MMTEPRKPEPPNTETRGVGERVNRHRHRPAGLALVGPLVQAAHIGPALAVTTLAAALAVAAGPSGARIVLITAAVLAGQLTIGWSNDLIDRNRDRSVGRPDKPLATGRISVRAVTVALGAAVAAAVLLSLFCGLIPALVHLACVAMGWIYNAGVKSTVWSWVPYALAFGGLTVFVALAATGELPTPWVPVVAALLGVGAHLVNALPDLAEDEATGVRGLPHRLGAVTTRMLAVTVLVAASILAVLASTDVGWRIRGLVLLAVGGLAVLALLTRGRTPFRAAVAIAFVDAVLLVATQ